MLLKNILLRAENSFEKKIESWAKENGIHVSYFDGKDSLFDIADALVTFNQDYNISRELGELQNSIEKLYKPNHQVDINGTLSASVNSFRFWLENNRPSNVLIVGADSLTENTRFDVYLEKLSEFVGVH